MYKISHKVVALSAISLILAANGSVSASDTLSADVTNAKQETQIWTTYALSPYLRASDLKVVVHEGKATLSGNVENDVNKDLAKQIALGVSGIKDVDNQIVVQSDYVAPTVGNTRSYGDVIDDATITAAIKSKLTWSKYTDGLATEVDTKAGKVTLSGTSDSAAAKDLAGRLAMNTRGVVSVDNQLLVTAAKPGAADAATSSAHQAEQYVADSWISTKVRSTFLYSRSVDGSAISVTTNNGAVTLVGKLDSGAERALAIELAKNVRGVKSVNSKGLTS